MGKRPGLPYHRGVADLDKLSDALTSKAAAAAGRRAAERAIDDLLSTDDERAEREKARAAASTSRRNKLILYGVIGLLLVVGVIGMVLNYWHWFILAGLLGLAGLYLWRRFAKRQKAAPDAPAETVRIAEPAPPPAQTAADDAAAERARLLEMKRERERDARARAEAAAVEQQEIDDELAAMKARLGK